MFTRTFLPFFCLVALGLGVSLIARAEQVQYLDRGDVAIARLYDDIRNAKDSVDISYYIWVPCSDSTKALVNLLAEKKRQNPKFRARLLLDGSGVQMNEQTTYLEKRGIEVKFFNERLVKFDPRRNMRTHVKATIVDGKRYVTGGRNIADDYFGMQDGLNWVDRDIAVVGGSARQMKAGFDRLWENRDSKRLEPASDADTAAFERSCIDGQRDELEEKETPAQLAKKNRDKKVRFKKVEDYLRQNSARIVKAAPSHNCSDVRAYFDDMTHGDVLPDRADDSSQKDYLSGERLARKVSTAALLKFLDDPELRNLSMENYSYIPPGKVNASLQAIRARKGNQINLYTNIFHKSGEPIDDVSNYYVRRDKAAGQISHGMRKYTGPAFKWALTTKEQDYAIHSKVYVANTKDTFVSSFNVDPRSYHTNGESAVWVKNCPALAKQVENEMRRLGAIAIEQQLLRNCGPEAEEVIDSIGGVDGIMNWMKHEFL